MNRFFSIKTLFYVFFVGLLIFLASLKNLLYSSKNKIENKLQIIETSVKEITEKFDGINNETKQKIKYILQWTSPSNVPFVYMGQGQNGFIDRNCSFTNCYVTGNKNFFNDIKEFDVIAFAGPEVVRRSVLATLPNRRSPHQKFAFASIESSDNYPICSNALDNYFNWTWTYKLKSDARWGYMVIRDSNNTIIGPNVKMHWMKLAEMDPISKKFKEKIKTKTKAAAWFVSNCYTKSRREKYVTELEQKLEKYKLSIDIYGDCGTLKCPREEHDKCTKMIETDYYFYLSFENSFAEDYVTEKLLYPLNNYAIPIVFGGANYTRFMPDGIYLNAKELGAEKLAEKMNELILNPDMYAEYFRWKNHYSYHRQHETVETDEYCRFCSMLNEEDLVKTISTYPNFREWWDPPNRC